MYLAYYVHLVGVKEVIGKGPEVFQKSRSSLNIFLRTKTVIWSK